jgi:hypothetical protein
LLRLTVGFIFTLLYHWLWQNTNCEPTFLMGIVLGSINGAIGIMIAIALIFIGRCQCHVPTKYFKNVMIAHLIFGTMAVFGFNIMHK